MNRITTCLLLAVCASGCATSADLAKRDQRIEDLTRRVDALTEKVSSTEAILLKAPIPELLDYIDEIRTAPVVQTELMGDPD